MDEVLGVSVKEAARYFKVHPATIRRWIDKEECPCTTLGSVGRTHTSRLDLKAVWLWRIKKKFPMLAAQADRDVLTIVETALYDSLKRDALSEKTGITQSQAEHVVLMIYERLYRNLTQQPLEFHNLPASMKRLHANFLDSVERERGNL